MSHAEDLRVEAQDNELADSIDQDYRTAKIDSAMKILLDACVKLTRTPWAMSADDVKELRNQGFGDEEIHDAFQVAAYFNYINRVADGFGIDLEEEMSPKPAGWTRD